MSLIVKRAFIVMLIVGPVLTVINQFNAIFGDGQLNFISMTLTFMVPFIVSSTTGFLTSNQFRQSQSLMQQKIDDLADFSRYFHELSELGDSVLNRAEVTRAAVEQRFHRATEAQQLIQPLLESRQQLEQLLQVFSQLVTELEESGVSGPINPSTLASLRELSQQLSEQSTQYHVKAVEQLENTLNQVADSTAEVLHQATLNTEAGEQVIALVAKLKQEFAEQAGQA